MAEVFISAGDPSGDIAGGQLLTTLRELRPELRLTGLGGDRMRAAGQEQFVYGSELAAMGFWEVAKRLKFFRRLLDRCVESIRAKRPAVITLIDYPGFNLRLAARVADLGLPIVYYIAPQVWAWHASRLDQLRKYVRQLAVILPFEREYFARHGIEAEFVGHYLFDDMAEFVRAPYDPNSRVIALLPGSRQQEVTRILPPMLQAARILGANNWSFRIAAVSRVNYEPTLGAFPEFRGALEYDSSRELMRRAALVVSASGTATLEAALIGRPLVALYKTSPVTYLIAKRLVTLPSIVLANLVAGERVAPELIQGQATGARAAQEIGALMGDVPRRLDMVDRFNRITDLFPITGASRRVADIVATYLPACG